MPRNETPEWFQIIVIAMIAAALFPTAFAGFFNSILLGLFVGIAVAVMIIAIWWYLENRDSGGL